MFDNFVVSADGNEGSLPDSLTIISDMMNLYELKRKPVWQMNGEELLELQRLAALQRVEFAEVKEPRLVYGLRGLCELLRIKLSTILVCGDATRRQGRKSYSMPKRYLKR